MNATAPACARERAQQDPTQSPWRVPRQATAIAKMESQKPMELTRKILQAIERVGGRDPSGEITNFEYTGQLEWQE